MLAETETLVIFDSAKEATSFDPFGTLGGVQFAALFQLLSTGLAFQVALPAQAQVGRETEQASRTAESRAKGFTDFL